MRGVALSDRQKNAARHIALTVVGNAPGCHLWKRVLLYGSLVTAHKEAFDYRFEIGSVH